MIKKLFCSILLMAAVALSAAPTLKSGDYSVKNPNDMEVAVFSDKILEAIATIAPLKGISPIWKTCDNVNLAPGGVPSVDFVRASGISDAEMQKLILDNLNKNSIPVVKSVNASGFFFTCYIERTIEGAKWFKTLPQETRIQIIATYATLNAGFASGDINKNYLLNDNAFVFENGFRWFAGSTVALSEYQAKMIAENTGENWTDILIQVNSRFVGTAKYSTEWQKFFKVYVKSLPVDKAKEVIKKELTAFAVNMNPDDAEQTKWLTTLRLLNTTYSEL